MAGAIPFVSGLSGGIGSLLDAVGKFVPAIGQIGQALTSFGKVVDVFKGLFAKGDTADQAAEDKKDKSGDFAGTVKTATDKVNAVGQGVTAFSQLASAFR
ncbi:MAG: hypothetical protein FJZ00_00130 [Candidatus Sericytochromatia bacterium]|uniref:Uncharacterized protein n=1 Tax=Candidatus Tanganyikabacteria bacterium TaxID=2961651 RepID=A0A938BHL6_9BACT|nr:hypothetical protein [Candidatus Tanganyikabacteria bacterium]